MKRNYLSIITAVLAICCAAFIAACGGGASHQASVSPSAPAAVTPVSVVPAAATIAQGAKQQFSSSPTAVTWFVDSVPGGNNSVGTITTEGLYTAPVADGSHTIAAMNQADETQSAKATVTVAAANSTQSSPGGSSPSGTGTGTATGTGTGKGTGTGTGTGGSTTPTQSTTNNATYQNIDEMGGWANCGACAGEGGRGPNVPYSLSQYASSPSMDGNAAHFWIGGRTPFADALWWKQLAPKPGATHFIYDLFFYYTNAGAVQALEFDGNQSVDGRKYIFGHQCNVAARQWDIWNTSGAYWVHTGIGCSAPPTYTWNHLVLEFERANGQTHFIAVTLNGQKSYFNRYGGSKAGGGNELNVAFQMDETSQAANYDVWLDKVNLTAF